MAFLSPLFLLGALAAAVPIVLHLLRQEPEASLKFAAVRMLQHAPVEHADKRRLRDLLLLALRVAALVLLAFAFARPFIASGAERAASGVTVVALDTSYSLSAPGRFARAQDLARTAVREAPAGHLVALVTFSDGAQVAQAATPDRALVLGAIGNARAGYGATRYRAALSTAADAIGDREGRTVVVTDLQANGWDSGERVDVPARVQVEVLDVGPLPANLAVTGLRLADNRLVATVRNAGPDARDTRLHLAVDGAPAGDASARIDPEQSLEVVLPPAKGATAAVTVEDTDGIQADNSRYLVLSESIRPLVLVVTNAGDLGRDAFYVEQALKATGVDGASFEVAAASGAQLSGWKADALARHAAIFLLSTRGLDQRGRELITSYMKRGGGVLTAISPDIDSQVLAGVVGVSSFDATVLPPKPGEGRVLAPADLRHPVFRAFATGAATLGLVTFRQVAVLRAPGCQPLARFSSGEAALAECPVGDGHLLLLASDLDGRWNDFPLHATFVPFLHEVVGYLGGNSSRMAGYLVATVPPGVPAEPGLQTLPAEGAGGTGRPVAVNVDSREADPARLTTAEFLAAVAPLQGEPVAPAQRVEARQQEERQNLWRYAILVMLAVLVSESVLAARTA